MKFLCTQKVKKHHLAMSARHDKLFFPSVDKLLQDAEFHFMKNWLLQNDHAIEGSTEQDNAILHPFTLHLFTHSL